MQESLTHMSENEKHFIQNQPIYVLCEGATEMNYLQMVNRFINTFDSKPIVFKYIDLTGGEFSNVKKRIHAIKKDNPKVRIVAWLDEDLWIRRPIKAKAFKQWIDSRNIKCFLNHCNGEDFLVLHMIRSTVMKWQLICEKHHHFDNPMVQNEYMPLLRKLDDCFQNYGKGHIPFDLDTERLNNLFENNSDPSIAFETGIADFLKQWISG